MEKSRVNISQRMIKQDASFIIGLLIALRKLNNESDIPFLFSSIDFISLVIYEASQYQIRNSTSMNSKLKSNFSEIVQQSRQRMKLFDDNVLGIEGIGDFFINTLTPVHQRELSKDHPFPLPRWMWSDIGIYVEQLSGIPVSTTHIASFNSGITNPNDFFSPETSRGLGQNLGSFLSLFADSVTLVRMQNISIITKDLRYEKIYSRENYGSTNDQINAGLAVIDMRLNFLALLSTKIVQWPTLFKWKFLSIYHAVSSLEKFTSSDHYRTLDPEKKACIHKVLNSPIGLLMKTDGIVPLRNTLIHYGIDSRIDMSKVTNDEKNLFGLVEACLPGWSYSKLHDFIDIQSKKVLLDIFEIWN